MSGSFKFDPAKIKPGDEVTVRARVHERRGEGFTIRSLRDERDPYVLPEHIVAHTPKGLAVGDRVTRCRHGQTRGHIKHVIEGRAWVDWSSGQQLIHQLADLERVDD